MTRPRFYGSFLGEKAIETYTTYHNNNHNICFLLFIVYFHAGLTNKAIEMKKQLNMSMYSKFLNNYSLERNT